jgi:hypothetical protein
MCSNSYDFSAVFSEYFPADESTPTGCGTLLQTEGAGFKQIIPYECLGAINVVKDKKVNVTTGKIIPQRGGRPRS